MSLFIGPFVVTCGAKGQNNVMKKLHQYWTFQYVTFTQLTSMHSLREISGTYSLIYVSLAIVSRLTRIIRSIDPTVANFQVNDPDL